ncbi:MAG: hypothetical protein PHI70_04325 [Proteiniphilum sp.]|nr:hypothetical protein [Proteiniphilum sp.]MDD3910043.1 hypothetical protein [Proteiniphilum sp.]MDD4415994.1 hypothetical protein [Proteiniphilum sp.]
MNVVHEFAHIVTLEDNLYIEAFHSIMEREQVSRYEIEYFWKKTCKLFFFGVTLQNKVLSNGKRKICKRLE